MTELQISWVTDFLYYSFTELLSHSFTDFYSFTVFLSFPFFKLPTFLLSVSFTECLIYWVSNLLSVSFTECLIYWVSHLLSVSFTDCLIYWLSHLLSVSCSYLITYSFFELRLCWLLIFSFFWVAHFLNYPFIFLASFTKVLFVSYPLQPN